jgi:Ca2+:H+ antiporter
MRTGFSRTDVGVLALALIFMAGAGATRYSRVGTVVPFVVAALALALMAAVVGRSVEALGDRLGAGATGVVQSALGNLPELFFGIFALRAGLVDVVRATIVGSILANMLLILGLAFVAGGLRHGTQRFDTTRTRTVALLLLLAVAVLVVPTLTLQLHTPAAQHEQALSVICAVVLLVVFVLSVPGSIKKDETQEQSAHPATWPLPVAITVLAIAALAAAFVSDWFVHALEPAITTLGISPAFAGLVVVAIAGNAVENVVGIQLAYRNRADYAVSVVLTSPLQIALALAPALVLLSPLVGASTLTLTFSPLLVTSLVLATVVTTFVVYDGESTWLEGTMLLGLYTVVAASFWWG